MALHFAKANGLQYVFNEKAFLANHRNADLHWIANLLKKRYPVPRELMEEFQQYQAMNRHDDNTQQKMQPEGSQLWEMDESRWLYVNYMRPVKDAFAEDEKKHARRSKLQGYFSLDPVCAGNTFDCFTMGYTFFNATRDLQDLLSRSDRGERHELKDRLAIHIRLGDIQHLEDPRTYWKVIQGLRRERSIELPMNEVHFVYYLDESTKTSNKEEYKRNVDRLQVLQRDFPQAQYHNLEATEDTILFLTRSTYMVTSGSSLSYLAAYLCPTCHVIYVMPKEYTKMTEDNFRKTCYYLDEWIPVIRYTENTPVISM
ncbi:hypothetical protein BGX28_009088 [Mortierella sp. GBA30]|nr:hypothetical protein BGX28_009088 [Mortierella sp. GBA30]